MSLLPSATYSAPGVSLYAPATGGGGSVGPNLTLSTLTLGVGQNSNANNLLLGTGILALAPVGDSNQVQIGTSGFNMVLGNQYSVMLDAANGAAGDITFGDILGNNSALVAINYQAVGLNSQNVSTLIYGNTFIEKLDGGAGGILTCSDLEVSSINGAAPGGGGGIQSTIANGAANISIPAGATPMSFNLTEGASFTTPGNAGTLLLNGNILNNATSAASFANGLTASTIASPFVTTTKLYPTSNQVFITQDTGVNFLLTFSGTGLGVGLAAQNSTDGMSFVTSNGGSFISGGGAGLALSNISSINGTAPALTSGVQSDVAALFSSLFAANPGLSTIVY